MDKPVALDLTGVDQGTTEYDHPRSAPRPLNEVCGKPTADTSVLINTEPYHHAWHHDSVLHLHGAYRHWLEKMLEFPHRPTFTEIC